jgi:uncharacterized protein (DUF885 family)
MRPRHGKARFVFLALALPIAAAVGCAQGYVPRLGEFMSLNQMRHAKLWYAGQAHNWALARYELDELQEGFDEIVRRYPTYQNVPTPISTLLPQIMTTPMANLRAAVHAVDPEAFTKAFDAFTAACNACHQSANREFNVIKRPEGNAWYANQEFALP